MARNTPWQSEGAISFSRIHFEKDGHAFDVHRHPSPDAPNVSAEGERPEWVVTVDGTEIGRAHAETSDWERSVYDLAISMWERHRSGKRRPE